ncbi:MAG: hypothetical protein HUJ26_03445 [Planctomycetaceae bacterium]|nr:hypothetical protein [Planctomycetaceae bacterium]
MNRISHKASRLCEPTRCGAVTIVVLLAMLIVFSIGLTMLETTLRERERTLQFEQRQQSTWLAESGIERAAMQLKSNPDYEGETWTLNQQELGGSDDGVVTIKVTPEENSDRRLVTVVADYPTDPHQHIRTSREILVDVSQPSNN